MKQYKYDLVLMLYNVKLGLLGLLELRLGHQRTCFTVSEFNRLWNKDRKLYKG